MDLATFFLQFPEFAQSDDSFVQAKLNEAAVRMGGPEPRTWGSFGTAGQLTIADIAQGNLAAHYLICAPFGTETRLAGDSGKDSVYRDRWQELVETVAGGVTVAGGGAYVTLPWSGC